MDYYINCMNINNGQTEKYDWKGNGIRKCMKKNEETSGPRLGFAAS